jgi:hypothetical protein
MPNQYTRVKNRAKGEDVIKENTDHTFTFVDEILYEAIESLIMYQTNDDVDYEYWSSNHNSHAKISISFSLHNYCMNLLHLPENITSVF